MTQKWPFYKFTTIQLTVCCTTIKKYVKIKDSMDCVQKNCSWQQKIYPRIYVEKKTRKNIVNTIKKQWQTLFFFGKTEDEKKNIFPLPCREPGLFCRQHLIKYKTYIKETNSELYRKGTEAKLTEAEKLNDKGKFLEGKSSEMCK